MEYIEDIQENYQGYQIRIRPSMLKHIQKYSKINSEGNVNRATRELIRIGLNKEIKDKNYVSSKRK